MTATCIQCENCGADTYYHNNGMCFDGERRSLCRDGQKCYYVKDREDKLKKKKAKQLEDNKARLKIARDRKQYADAL